MPKHMWFYMHPELGGHAASHALHDDLMAEFELGARVAIIIEDEDLFNGMGWFYYELHMREL